MSFTCPRCNATSHHPKDEEFGYCGRCHWWTGDPYLGKPEVVNAAVDEGAIRPLAEVLARGHHGLATPNRAGEVGRGA